MVSEMNFMSMGKPFAALSFLRHGFRNEIHVNVVSEISQIFMSMNTLRGSTTELRVIRVCGSFL